MIFVVLFEDQPGTGMEVRLQHMPQHIEFLLRNSEKIYAAGPLKERDGSLAGGMWTVQADNTDEVQELVEEDPFWSVGLRKTVRILSWQQVFAEGKSLIGQAPGS